TQNLLTKWYSHLFLSTISTPPEAWNRAYDYLKNPAFDFVYAGIFFILCILQLFLYIYDRAQKVSLYFMLYALWQCLINFSDAFQYLSHAAASFFSTILLLAFCFSFSIVF